MVTHATLALRYLLAAAQSIASQHLLVDAALHSAAHLGSGENEFEGENDDGSGVEDEEEEEEEEEDGRGAKVDKEIEVESGISRKRLRRARKRQEKARRWQQWCRKATQKLSTASGGLPCIVPLVGRDTSRDIDDPHKQVPLFALLPQGATQSGSAPSSSMMSTETKTAVADAMRMRREALMRAGLLAKRQRLQMQHLLCVLQHQQKQQSKCSEPSLMTGDDGRDGDNSPSEHIHNHSSSSNRDSWECSRWILGGAEALPLYDRQRHAAVTDTLINLAVALRELCLVSLPTTSATIGSCNSSDRREKRINNIGSSESLFSSNDSSTINTAALRIQPDHNSSSNQSNLGSQHHHHDPDNGIDTTHLLPNHYAFVDTQWCVGQQSLWRAVSRYLLPRHQLHAWSRLSESHVLQWQQRCVRSSILLLYRAHVYGDTRASHLLGLCFSAPATKKRTDGVEMSAAQQWCTEAAERGHTPAMLHLQRQLQQRQQHHYHRRQELIRQQMYNEDDAVQVEAVSNGGLPVRQRLCISREEKPKDALQEEEATGRGGEEEEPEGESEFMQRKRDRAHNQSIEKDNTVSIRTEHSVDVATTDLVDIEASENSTTLELAQHWLRLAAMLGNRYATSSH